MSVLNSLLPFFSLLLISAARATTLKMVHLVYRHGARSPTNFYPNDRYQAADWPDGAGRLTQKGMTMEYNLGKFLKKRYMEDAQFLNQTYHHREVYIRSSDVDRCIQSAQAQLAGLYPPHGYQVWNKEILWQPLPVHTVPKDEDVVLRADDVKCERLSEMWEEHHQTNVYQGKEQENEELLQHLSNRSGMTVTAGNLYFITDSTICEQTEGWPIPSWITKVWNQTNSYSEWLFDYRFMGNDEFGRLLGGEFLHIINSNMEKMMTGKEEDKDGLHKMNIFSGHDTSLLSLSTALDINIGIPHFSSCIMIELHQSSTNQTTVQMYYRNTQTDQVKPLKLKKCPHVCPFNDFLRLTKPRTTEDRSKLCAVGVRKWLTKFNLEVAVVILGVICFCLLGVLVFSFARRRLLIRYERHVEA